MLVFVIIVGWQVSVLTSEDGAGLIGKREPGVSTIFVHQDFSGDESYNCFMWHVTQWEKLPGDIFDQLVSLGAYLVGPPAILEMGARGEKLWVKIIKRSPLFSLQVSFTLTSSTCSWVNFKWCWLWYLIYLPAAWLQYCPLWIPQKVSCEEHARKGGLSDFP